MVVLIVNVLVFSLPVSVVLGFVGLSATLSASFGLGRPWPDATPRIWP